MSPVSEPERSVLVATVTALATPNPETFVLARYAGDIYRRIDLASLAGQIPVDVDVDARLDQIAAGLANSRAHNFATTFPGKTAILELEVPTTHYNGATIRAWIWNARAWECWMPGESDYLDLALENDHWNVSATTKRTDVSLAETDCP